ncbi:MBL fold metallo-hydrolase [Aureitalea sp. L0-47]|uniref:MBL fold metallo-hydrolase n=1 Tax=Aureitalea sp. L0-47 TaxID=2816962 RepID=UPI0022377A26|nr:MBL fold metallo-hydrolase [Aureitalea sp. L0-47]
MLLILCTAISCKEKSVVEESTAEFIPYTPKIEGPALVVLGTLQDAGSPHIACKKECCKNLFDTPDATRKVVSLGLVFDGKTYLFEATPDISTQVKLLQRMASSEKELPDGIFLTHAHIGHYTGLMYFGREATNADKIPVYTMPRMKEYLETNGPWSQLVDLQNITLRELSHREKVELSSQVEVVPFLVPHRDEYSETVGYIIEAFGNKIVFIPDIDKWEKWERSIVEIIEEVDYAFLDATFYSGEEINTRDISEIPHPFIIESIALFDSLPASEKKKIHFIHFNHTNPVLDTSTTASKKVIEKGYRLARYGQIINL